MRVMPSRYTTRAQPLKMKQRVAALQHIQAPLKGLSLVSKLVQGDPLTAPILDNWIVEEDRITCRAGSKLMRAISPGRPVVCLVPFYGDNSKLAAATDGKLYDILTGTLIKDGFSSDDWHWTAFSNLSSTDFTVMVNGKSGVWSWDGAAMVSEAVTAPSGASHIVPAQFQIVVSHMNRLWFADSSNLAVYYLPLQQKSGEVKELPLNAIFKRGGSVRAIYTWTVDGGMGLDDQLVIFSTNGEAAIYGGTDPDTDMTLTGVYRFDSPMSKHAVVQYGGELYVLISTGLVPMSTLMRAESENLGKQDRSVYSMFASTTRTMRDRSGWGVILNPSSGRIICNLPLGAQNTYRQMVRFMPAPVWASWSNLPARCWGWIDNRMFFGSDTGRIYELNPAFLSDDGNQPIKVDVQSAWSSFRTPAIKHFKMIKPYLITDGMPRPLVDIRTDYDDRAPFNQPDVTQGSAGSEWDISDWDEAEWAQAVVRRGNWNGVAAIGVVGAVRMTALVRNCTFSLAGWDVLYEPGSAI